MPGDPLEQAIQLIKTGEKLKARFLLIEILKRNPQQEIAWMWLAETASSSEERISILRSCLKYNPASALAQRALLSLTKPPEEKPLTASPDRLTSPEAEGRQEDADAQLQEVAAMLGMGSQVAEETPAPSTQETLVERMHQAASQPEAAVRAANLPIERPKNPRRHLPRWVWWSLLITFLIVAGGFVVFFTMLNQPPVEELPPTLENTAVLPTETPAPSNTPTIEDTPTPRATWTPYLSPTASLTPTITPTPTLTPTVTPLTFNPLTSNRQVIAPANLSQITYLGDLGQGAVFAPVVNWVAKVQFNEIVVWDATTNREVSRFELQFGNATGLAISDDGRWVAASNTSFLIQVWELPSGNLTHSFGTGNSFSIPPDTSTQMLFSSDGNYLAVSNKGVFTVWDMRDASQPITFFGADTRDIQKISQDSSIPPYFSVAFSPDNTRVAASGYHNLLIVDLVTRETNQITEPDLFQQQVQFSPDGKYVAAAGSGEVNLYSAFTGHLLHSFTGVLLIDHTPSPFVFLPNGNEIAILSDGECCGQTLLKRFSLSNGTFLGAAEPYEKPPSRLEYSPLGDLFIEVIPAADEIRLSGGGASISLNGFDYLRFTNDQRAILGMLNNSLVLYGITP